MFVEFDPPDVEQMDECDDTNFSLSITKKNADDFEIKLDHLAYDFDVDKFIMEIKKVPGVTEIRQRTIFGLFDGLLVILCETDTLQYHLYKKLQKWQFVDRKPVIKLCSASLQWLEATDAKNKELEAALCKQRISRAQLQRLKIRKISKRLLITNLPPNYTSGQVKDIFGKFHRIRHLSVHNGSAVG